MYLVLMTGGNQPLPVALGTGEEGGAARFEHQVFFNHFLSFTEIYFREKFP